MHGNHALRRQPRRLSRRDCEYNLRHIYMTVADFIAKWRHHELKERSAAQEHFIDLCRVVGHPTPAQADPEGKFFTFERGAAKATGGEGWADVWKKDFFGWEYKGLKHDLGAAYRQLLLYF